MEQAPQPNQSIPNWQEVQAQLETAQAGQPVNPEFVKQLIQVREGFDVIYSGGSTIPGTDEWIPGEKNYYFVFTDAEGKKSSQPLDSDLAERIIKFTDENKLNSESADTGVDTEPKPTTVTTAAPIETPKQSTLPLTPPAPGQTPEQLPPPVPQQKAEGLPAQAPDQMPEQLPQQNAGDLAAPKAEDLLIKGSEHKDGKLSFRENDGKFMSKEKVAEIGAEAKANKPAAVEPEISAKKSWTEMTDEEQLAQARAEGYKDAYADKERDTLVLGKKYEADEAPAEATPGVTSAVAEDDEPFDIDPADVKWADDDTAVNTAPTPASEADTAASEEFLSDEEYINIIMRIAGSGTGTRANAAEPASADAAGEAVDETDEEAEDVIIHRGLKQRLTDAKNAVYVSVGTFFGRAREQDATPENRKSKKGLWIGLGAVAAAGTALLALKYGLNNSVSGRSSEMGDILSQPPAPSGSGSVDITPAAEVLPVSPPSGSGSIQLAEQAANAPAETPVATFTAVDHRWQEGDPTIWSFVRSQGVPESKVADLLNEWNSDWASVGQNMQPGESVDIPVELINKYKQAGLPETG